MNDKDPFKDPYGIPYTEKEIKDLYVKFMEAYYKKLFDEQSAERTLQRIYKFARGVSWKGARVIDETTLIGFMKRLSDEGETLCKKLAEARNQQPFWKRWLWRLYARTNPYRD